MALKGSCLCGAVTYEVDRLGPIGHCHCHTCRKAHAAAFATTARAERSAFRWCSGESLLGQFESTPGKLRHFCTRCGSHLMAHWVHEAQVIVRVATLDDDPGVRPVAHIWMADAVPWLAYGDDLPTYDHAAPRTA
ncbi:MAG TPA: GFA family protein [Burkholderiaceae bacterium]|nr:GFA family protein [Burkholderiaceae bacterium]